MSKLICQMVGARGRSIDIYDNKCVIITDVTLGSVLTNNALDGRKTIFYKDVVGIQFKQSGFTIGYLQLETPSMQMNNQNSNAFSENTFTFEESTNKNMNFLMELVHDYIEDRIESYKYEVPSQEALLRQLVAAAQKEHVCSVNPDIVREIEIKKREQEEAAEKKRLEEEENKKQKMEEMRNSLKKDGAAQFEQFLSWAEKCGKIKEIQDLWEKLKWEDNDMTKFVEEKISRAVYVERIYGSGKSDILKLLRDLKEMI